MNYTPERADGGIDLARALEINVQFDLSRQFWAHLVTSEKIPDPTCFIRPCPHLSFVSGADNVTFLKKRHAAMASTHKWQGMEYNEDPAVLVDWAPLLMARRDTSEPIAATRMVTGSDVDYGTLTRILVDHLNHGANVAVLYNTEVQDLTRGGARRGCGGSRPARTKRTATTARCEPGGCSSARAVGRCRSCRRAAFPKADS